MPVFNLWPKWQVFSMNPIFFVEAGQWDFICITVPFFARRSYNHAWLNNATTIWKATHNSFVLKIVSLFSNLYRNIKQVFNHHKAKQTYFIIKLSSNQKKKKLKKRNKTPKEHKKTHTKTFKKALSTNENRSQTKYSKSTTYPTSWNTVNYRVSSSWDIPLVKFCTWIRRMKHYDFLPITMS